MNQLHTGNQPRTGTNACAAPAVVIDTNCVLDLWVFRDPGIASLHAALTQGRVRWIATCGMRAELARVLGYPQLQPRLLPPGPQAAQVLALFDQWAHPTPPAPPAPVRCHDPDDQPFIDLAIAHRASLFSKDASITRLTRRLAPLGVTVQRDWP